MGRHSRRGPAPKGDSADIAARRGGRGDVGSPGPQGQGAPAQQPGAGQQQGVAPWQGMPAAGGPSVYGDPVYRVAQGARPPEGTPARGVPRLADGTPARGVPRLPDGTPARGVPRLPDGTPARGVPRLPDGAPARGVPRFADGTPARGVPRLPDGTPAHGVPRLPDGTPAHGVPRFPVGGTPAHGTPRVRGGHPEQREGGGGWGELGARGVSAGPGVTLPRQRQAPPGGPRQAGPRQDYLDAFGDEDVDLFSPRTDQDPAFSRRTAHPSAAPDPYASVSDWQTVPEPRTGVDVGEDAAPTGEPVRGKGGKGRTFTGIAAAAVTTVLAVVVAGQVADRRDDTDVQSQSATDQARDARDSASRGDGRPTPSSAPSVATLTYEQKMDKKYALAAGLAGSGKFDAVKGVAKAPGSGQKYTYRVDVEQGLGLDAELFAEAVQKTLNDDRSWAHRGARTFERIYSGKPDFVITLASPGTTAKWCAKSGLDTTVDNVSCDSAATERVMINAYRWAQGSKTYGDQIHAYRQMLINHEVGHRLGNHHVTCDKDGELAPVMQQQTKFLDHDGIHCLPNPWPYPGS
ncbi:DUF3152 domain-containing protein [Streptomyces justiciae]|uniref:DUF3152 domain-containing protein n=1 Tax=Streptomyces justiciae TaxID=2780140 RepID=UPI0018823750|nr:DUF3152 domain-containing protein [Streptomyces justiciae]MBE8472447.1 DUF3152 domain-containing protein [Streptomyces justiciae]